ncbi:hydantoinase subunit beta [Tetragenococcus osmophilus]|uniref:Hydantoinase subunit beta n=1 Tax=Tetragenococcus osmophilus TaxID=526944 RepID=A0AA38CZE3_9ENTE|nr:hydantoinase/oxoprolinase family protein [Tetragenococcus osmophilus]AYW47294.1 hydantoinase subunit beta [Tetragenococcus osmophilus]GMA52823.1 hydantoinase subunit beta [Alicyclobacillus contaminans]GMA73179.1 hydantoinase subunit beta [Tetragenococcus osmophilus]
MNYKIGIDVGGTNTDAAILDEDLNLVHSVKSPTSEDIESGIFQALHRVLQEANIDQTAVTHAMLGTTQCTNAIVERKKLAKVGVLRLGYPATVSVTPFTAWPQDIVDVLTENYAIAKGGYEFDGKTLSAFDEQEIRDILTSWQGKVEAVAIVGVFSSLKNDQEFYVHDIAREVLGEDVSISLSSTIGSVGLIERENATILNAALFKVMQATSDGFEKALAQEGVKNAEVYLCQNDGTLMSIDYAREFPILTIACGPTNSIRGASYLAGLENAVVLDVGGTTSDIGVITDGFPRESSVAVDVGGVRTNFRMPDIVSIGLGGGSIVRQAENGEVTVGPDSVGYKISEKALVLGGDTLTATDIAVRLGKIEISDSEKVAHITQDFAEKAEAKIAQMVEEAIDRMKTSSGDVTLILVGGGNIIVPDQLKGVEEIIRDEKGAVANAIGASISQIGGQYEQIYIYSQIAREQALQDAREKADDQAMKAGAIEGTIELVEVEEIPLAYHPDNATRLRVKVVGDLVQS